MEGGESAREADLGSTSLAAQRFSCRGGAGPAIAIAVAAVAAGPGGGGRPGDAAAAEAAGRRASPPRLRGREVAPEAEEEEATEAAASPNGFVPAISLPLSFGCALCLCTVCLCIRTCVCGGEDRAGQCRVCLSCLSPGRARRERGACVLCFMGRVVLVFGLADPRIPRLPPSSPRRQPGSRGVVNTVATTSSTTVWIRESIMHIRSRVRILIIDSSYVYS